MKNEIYFLCLLKQMPRYLKISTALLTAADNCWVVIIISFNVVLLINPMYSDFHVVRLWSINTYIHNAVLAQLPTRPRPRAL